MSLYKIIKFLNWELHNASEAVAEDLKELIDGYEIQIEELKSRIEELEAND